MADDFDHLEDDYEQAGRVPARGRTRPATASPGIRPHETIYRVGERADTGSRVCSALALLTGLGSIALGGASAAHELAPAYLDPNGTVPGRFIAIACATLIGVTLILVIAAKASRPRNTSRRGTGATGLVAMFLAVLLLALGVVVGILFPAGLIRPAMRDEAPVGSEDGMRYSIERVTGTCEGGWTDVDVHAYPGVQVVAVCPTTRVAYALFESDTAAGLYRTPLETKVVELLDEHADDTQAQGDWCMLTGGRWVAFGGKDAMTLLEQEWGGKLDTVGTTDTTGAQQGQQE
ncbi:hypothetical protein JS531_07620 [Bifidobacterium sp. CP2]|uniref:hypothetical protein n=1 Tax=Bifidobacterium sp. CP2 TaxID=2809025 RepID=UPI001BDCAACE|nr:hypothetical protein [Bifidobacterium sp. CP2]MBT1181821.1 hypothetical protein [Bifidobacterium sp. CP2]